MEFPLYLLFPFASAFSYALAALFLKRAMADGVGPWRIMFFSNLVLGVLFLPFLFFESGERSDVSGLWYQPVLCTLVFLGGQTFTFLALHRGDVSIATPLLGAKVIFVAFFTVVLLGERVPGVWWVAAVLTFVSVFLLRGENRAARRRLGFSVVLSLLAAISFALTDISVQHWAPQWGVERFMPIVFLLVAIGSFAFIPLFRRGFWSLPPGTWKWLGPGASLFALQAFCLGYAVAVYGNATAINIVYNTRGIWSIVFVLFIGAWFENMEKEQGARAMGQRLIGAVLMVLAVVLVVVVH